MISTFLRFGCYTKISMLSGKFNQFSYNLIVKKSLSVNCLYLKQENAQSETEWGSIFWCLKHAQNRAMKQSGNLFCEIKWAQCFGKASCLLLLVLKILLKNAPETKKGEPAAVAAVLARHPGRRDGRQVPSGARSPVQRARRRTCNKNVCFQQLRCVHRALVLAR